MQDNTLNKHTFECPTPGNEIVCICGGIIDIMPATGYTSYECPLCGSVGSSPIGWDADDRMDYEYKFYTMSVCDGVKTHTQDFKYDYETHEYTQCSQSIKQDTQGVFISNNKQKGD